MNLPRQTLVGSSVYLPNGSMRVNPIAGLFSGFPKQGQSVAALRIDFTDVKLCDIHRLAPTTTDQFLPSPTSTSPIA